MTGGIVTPRQIGDALRMRDAELMRIGEALERGRRIHEAHVARLAEAIHSIQHLPGIPVPRVTVPRLPKRPKRLPAWPRGNDYY